jgi:hypothetical protein
MFIVIDATGRVKTVASILRDYFALFMPPCFQVASARVNP